jgi:hypothetical protein
MGIQRMCFCEVYIYKELNVFSVLRSRFMCSYAKLFGYADAELCKGSRRATLSSDGINFSVNEGIQ